MIFLPAVLPCPLYLLVTAVDEGRAFCETQTVNMEVSDVIRCVFLDLWTPFATFRLMVLRPP